MPVSGKQVAWGSLSTLSPPPRARPADAVAHRRQGRPRRRRSRRRTGAAPRAERGGSATSRKSQQGRSPPPLQLVDLMSAPNATVVAVQDGRVVRLGSSRELGKYLILRDVYGDVFTYAGLGSIATHYPRPKAHPQAALPRRRSRCRRQAPMPSAKAPGDRRRSPARDLEGQSPPPSPRAPAQRCRRGEPAPASTARCACSPTRQPRRARLGGQRGSAARRSHSAGKMLTLRAGSIVAQGTVLGTVRTPHSASDGHLRFAIRPAGDQSTIDPRPILRELGAARGSRCIRRARRPTRPARRHGQRRVLAVQGRTRARGALGPGHRDLRLRSPGIAAGAVDSACWRCSPSSRAAA